MEKKDIGVVVCCRQLTLIEEGRLVREWVIDYCKRSKLALKLRVLDPPLVQKWTLLRRAPPSRLLLFNPLKPHSKRPLYSNTVIGK